MKKWMMLVLLATCTLGAQAADREMKAANDTLVVTTTPQMHCANCEKKIKDHIRFVKGTKKIETSVPKQTVTIVYDSKKSNECGSLSECIPENWLRSESGQALKKGAPESDRCPFFRIHARKLFRFSDPLPVKGIADTCQ